MNKAKKIISILFNLDFLQYAFFFVVTARLFMSLQPTSTNAVYVFSVYALSVLEESDSIKRKQKSAADAVHAVLCSNHCIKLEISLYI